MNTENFDLPEHIINELAERGYSPADFMELVQKAKNEVNEDLTEFVVFGVLDEACYSMEDAWRVIQEYRGCCEDFTEFCQEIFDDVMECPEAIKPYINYDKWAEACSYDYLQIECHGKIYCFWNV